MVSHEEYIFSCINEKRYMTPDELFEAYTKKRGHLSKVPRTVFNVLLEKLRKQSRVDTRGAKVRAAGMGVSEAKRQYHGVRHAHVPGLGRNDGSDEYLNLFNIVHGA